MDPLIVARWQFGITTVYHFLFVPLTIGLALFVATLESLYVRTKDLKYLRATKFWGKLFLINFAVGIVTGIVQEFQFGMNWSSYSRYVGDIFGAPLALEGLLAFFLESTFLGLWIFGWRRLSARQHLFTAWMVSLGTIVSAFWILAANAWMHNPVGYTINAETGRAELASFLDVVTNPVAWAHFVHTVLAAVLTAAVLMLAISSWHLLRRNQESVFRASAGLASVVVLVTAIGVALSGHFQGQITAEKQPMKLAATEALWETEQPAAFSLIALIDENGRHNSFDIKVPRLLSFLATNSLDAEVRGINNIQAEYEELYGEGVDYIPPVNVVYWSFRLMVAVGTVLIAIGALGTYFLWRRRLGEVRWFHRIALWSLGLPVAANLLGWIVTEIGRQPWAVQGLLLVEDSVSPSVSGAAVFTTLLGFTVLYGVLAAVDVYLMSRYAKAGISDETTPEEVGASLAY
jgi:cytochrome d ubiquinol oxidase subunit I